MSKASWLAAAAALILAAATATAAEVVVLKGGSRIELKQPPVQQGNNVLLTRVDGTLFSVPASEVDWKATAAARKAPAPKPAGLPAAPADTPAEAARATREAPKARVKITDSDVNHVAEPGEEVSEEAKKEPAEASRSATAHVEVADYSQDKSGNNLLVRGNLRNVGSTSAINVSMSVTAIDEAGKGIGSGPATLSKGVIEPGRTVAFSAALPVGDKVPRSIRFTPLWIPEAAAVSPASSGNAAAPSSMTPSGSAPAPAPAPQSSSQPAPVPTPYGQGLLYAPPAASAATAPPADGKDGYIPGAARPEDQPKPPE